jgi:hypothetical protein
MNENINSRLHDIGLLAGGNYVKKRREEREKEK